MTHDELMELPRNGGIRYVDKCHCGRSLHYSSAEAEAVVCDLVNQLGEFITIRLGNRAWRVQRHYIALHRIRAVDLPKLGFAEIQ